MFAYIDAYKVLQIVAKTDDESCELNEWWERNFTLACKPRKNREQEIQITYYEQDQ